MNVPGRVKIGEWIKFLWSGIQTYCRHTNISLFGWCGFTILDKEFLFRIWLDERMLNKNISLHLFCLVIKQNSHEHHDRAHRRHHSDGVTEYNYAQPDGESVLYCARNTKRDDTVIITFMHSYQNTLTISLDGRGNLKTIIFPRRVTYRPEGDGRDTAHEGICRDTL